MCFPYIYWPLSQRVLELFFIRLQLNKSNRDREFPRNCKARSVQWPLADLVINLKEIQKYGYVGMET